MYDRPDTNSKSEPQAVEGVVIRMIKPKDTKSIDTMSNFMCKNWAWSVGLWDIIIEN